MSAFTERQMQMFSRIAAYFGEPCEWVPGGAEGVPPLTATVLFNNPTRPKKTDGREFDPVYYWVEYQQGDLPLLFERVRAGGTEFITVSSVTYYVQKVISVYDGGTFRAMLQPPN